MTTDDRLTTAIIAGSTVSGAALIIATIAWSWPLQTLAGLLQVLGLGLAAVGVGVVHAGLQRVVAVALGVKDAARHQLTLRRHALRGWWARRHGLPPPTIRVGASWALSYDIHDDLVRDRPGTGPRDHAALLAAVDADLDKAFARINKIKDSIASTRNELRDEIQRETGRGWQLILGGLACSAVGTLVGIWA